MHVDPLFLRESTPCLARLSDYAIRIERLYDSFVIAACTPFLVHCDGQLYEGNVEGVGLADLNFYDVEYMLSDELATIHCCLHADYYRVEHILELEQRARDIWPGLRRHIRESMKMYREALRAQHMLN